MLELHITAETLTKMVMAVDKHLENNVIDDELAIILRRSLKVAGPYHDIIYSMWSAVIDHNFELYRIA
jgi:hypothetical protein